MTAGFDPVYHPENIKLFETIYGSHLISLGGLPAIDNMFTDVHLQGLKLLDIGFGLGGVAFYLAQKYRVAIAGVELQSWMVAYAKQHTPKDCGHLLEFAIYTDTHKIPYQTASFDIAYSKGVLNHVHDKQALFIEINRVLKSKGSFVIADWLHPVTDNSQLLAMETQESYQNILMETGFIKIQFRDDSLKFIGYVKKLLDNVFISRNFIENSYGKEIFNTILDDHQKLIEDLYNKNKFAVRILAMKV